MLEQPLPPVLNQLVSEFILHMKQQTSTGDEIDKFSDSSMKKVQEETRAQRQVSNTVCDVTLYSGVWCVVCRLWEMWQDRSTEMLKELAT